MSRFRSISRGGVIRTLLFMFLFTVFCRRWDVGGVIQSWILYIVVFSPSYLFFFFLDPYLRSRFVGIPTMIGAYIISLLTFILLSILIIGYEPWMNGLFLIIASFYCMRLARFTYEERKHR